MSLDDAVYDRIRGGYRVFIGDLGNRIGKYEIEKEFKDFGSIIDTWVARNPPGFAFLVFKHAEDAESAVRRVHGRRVAGRRIRVEHARPFEERRRLQVEGSRRSSHRSRSRSRDRRKHRSRSRDKRRKSRSRSGSKSKKSRKSRKSKSRSRSRSGGRSKSHEKRTSSRQSPSPEKSTVASKKENGHDEKGKSREQSMEKSREKSRKESRSISPADTKVHNVEKCEIDCGLTEQETKKRQKSEERNGVTKDGSDDNTGSKRKRKNLEVEMNEDSE
ncbi:probable splicing factor, arginine/serine-rich 6 isoform X1 [Mya arenaria]|uniref:probable splicing factor, arginine/serine-rich 6 isoform X1 n=1 Tax=Mya arenaria TaxID=6604 RepID=UPI0022E6E858|nr:probable splicing factor, arginine/serine-rich 6 isoform X1 [Mya arenaria]